MSHSNEHQPTFRVDHNLDEMAPNSSIELTLNFDSPKRKKKATSKKAKSFSLSTSSDDDGDAVLQNADLKRQKLEEKTKMAKDILKSKSSVVIGGSSLSAGNKLNALAVFNNSDNESDSEGAGGEQNGDEEAGVKKQRGYVVAPDAAADGQGAGSEDFNSLLNQHINDKMAGNHPGTSFINIQLTDDTTTQFAPVTAFNAPQFTELELEFQKKNKKKRKKMTGIDLEDGAAGQGQTNSATDTLAMISSLLAADSNDQTGLWDQEGAQVNQGTSDTVNHLDSALKLRGNTSAASSTAATILRAHGKSVHDQNDHTQANAHTRTRQDIKQSVKEIHGDRVADHNEAYFSAFLKSNESNAFLDDHNASTRSAPTISDSSSASGSKALSAIQQLRRKTAGIKEKTATSDLFAETASTTTAIHTTSQPLSLTKSILNQLKDRDEFDEEAQLDPNPTATTASMSDQLAPTPFSASTPTQFSTDASNDISATIQALANMDPTTAPSLSSLDDLTNSLPPQLDPANDMNDGNVTMDAPTSTTTTSTSTSTTSTADSATLIAAPTMSDDPHPTSTTTTTQTHAKSTLRTQLKLEQQLDLAILPADLVKVETNAAAYGTASIKTDPNLSAPALKEQRQLLKKMAQDRRHKLYQELKQRRAEEKASCLAQNIPLSTLVTLTPINSLCEFIRSATKRGIIPPAVDQAQKLAADDEDHDIEYFDENGAKISAREAFKLQSRVFHGNKMNAVKAGKKKAELEQKRVAALTKVSLPDGSVAEITLTDRQLGKSAAAPKKSGPAQSTQQLDSSKESAAAVALGVKTFTSHAEMKKLQQEKFKQFKAQQQQGK